MYEKLRKFILPQLIPSESRVMVAVSGGPDSMALSHIFWRYVQEESWRGISLVLTHVHHGVRKESDEEADLVRQMAKKWNVPCIIHCFDAKQYAKSTGQSFQEAAREWRYSRWKEDMAKEGCSLLATAHHLGDQAETILFRLLRGSGTAGLAGMYPSKGSIIRPLLTFTKADILHYCESESVPYALDRSNEEPVYVRNRIRLELLPELERSYNSRIQEALGRTGELLRWDEEYFDQQVEAAWKRYRYKDFEGTICLSLDVFKEPAAILSRLLRKAAMQVTQEPRGLGFAYVAKIMSSQGKLGWVQDLPGLRVRISEVGLRFSPSHINSRQNDGLMDALSEQQGLNSEIPLVMGQWTKVSNLKMAIGLFKEWNRSTPNYSDRCENKIAVFSRGLLTRTSEQSLVCRVRREGDKMWFKGVGHKPLKKIFQEAKVADKERNSVPLIAIGTEVLWIPGVRQSGLYNGDYDDEKMYCILIPLRGCSNLNSL
ncbi:tRNA lysidine(34) synthetase TilS [Desulfosporosinus shakirovi]|uniref:tRNA lysidine(34) synthetase TilS n=1 Tax=Desulfosporosinus shakirovi TaxID=2885154 RepID=UPI001E3A8941|nr:tRNA lysidine(34) synthetase TilS [Desulfosporosinus sp. SRJS8]MCB8816755.1 tRNA lysidine(34) synthetase TilS [Desulfosporosinus sp. SRJS8]